MSNEATSVPGFICVAALEPRKVPDVGHLTPVKILNYSSRQDDRLDRGNENCGSSLSARGERC